jgi:hypothetical protein
MDADDIDEYLSEESELDKMIEDAIDEFEHPKIIVITMIMRIKIFFKEGFRAFFIFCKKLYRKCLYYWIYIFD